jgi:hypothetical protein
MPRLRTPLVSALAAALAFASSAFATEITIASPGGLGPGPITFNVTASNGVTITLTAPPPASYTFDNPLIINADESASSGVSFDGANGSTWLFPSLTLNGNVSLGTEQYSTVSFANVTLNGNVATYNGFAFANVSGAGSVTAYSNLTLNGASTYSGGTTGTFFATITANNTGSLGSGPVAISASSTLVLNAAATADADIIATPDTTLGGTILYNANAAAHGHHLTANSIQFASSVTSFGGDTFTVTANGYLSGNSAALATLIRNANLTLAPGTIVENTDKVLPTIQNLGTASDLILGLHNTSSLSVNIGMGTPWAGMAGTFFGTINPSSDITLHNFIGQYDVLAAAPIHVTFTGGDSDLTSSSRNFSGVSSFSIAPGATLTLDANNALGGATGTSAVPLDVSAGATLLFAGFNHNTAFINAPATFHTGATLQFSINSHGGLHGSGALSRDPGPLTFIIEARDAFSGSQLTPAFTRPGDNIYLNIDNVEHLQDLNPAAAYIVSYPRFQTQDLNLNGGSLQFSSFGLSTLGSLAGTGVLRIGPDGATFLAPGSYTALSFNRNVATISMSVIATGTLRIGPTDPAATFGHGALFLSAANSLADVSVRYAALGVLNPAALADASLCLDHAFLFLNPAKLSDPSATPTYNNTFSILGDSTLNDHVILFGPVSAGASVPRLAIGTVNLGANLHFLVGSAAFRIANLHLTADAALSSRTNNRTIDLDLLSQDAPHALTLQGETGIKGARFRVASFSTFSSNLVVDNATLLLTAPQDPASTPTFFLAANATLDFAANYDFTSGLSLTGDGLVIIDANTALTLPIDTTFSGTIQVNGTLILAPALNPDNANITPAFTILPTPIPEPATLLPLLLAGPLLARPRRR